MNKQQFYFFIDETGDHGLNFVDERFPIFLFAGCLISQAAILCVSEYCNSENKFQNYGAGIHKKKYLAHNEKSGRQLLDLCLFTIIERLLYSMATIHDIDTVEIVAEKRGKREDKELLLLYQKMTGDTSLSSHSQHLRSIIRHFEFHAKSDNSTGLQLADLCAYPIARFIMRSEEPNLSFEILRQKLYQDVRRNMHGYGIEILP